MVLVLDGGLATTLEARGHDLRGGLWSARLLADDPQAIVAVHEDFFRAGARVATTASYQLSALSLTLAGGDPDDEAALLARSVELAQQARDEWRPDGLVVGSLGPFGASRADGSEYTGRYDLGDAEQTRTTLRAFHASRIGALLDAGVDLIAAETIPSAIEVEALAEELIGVPAWVALSPAPGGLTTRTGEPLAEAVAPLKELPLAAAGVNCCHPSDVAPALAIIGATTELPLVAYPNSGETWDPDTRRWVGQPCFDEFDWLGPDRTPTPGLALAGGCCRVGPESILRLAQRLGQSDGATPSTLG